jgi:ribonucleoside-diphosphate reductase alpha chain
MAIAPTASIGLVAGTTPGFDPQFSQIFSRSTSSGKFLEVNRNLVATLQERGIWQDVREAILRSQGDIQNIAEIPDEVKATFKTSFQLSPYAFIEVAARAQKWIDQAISRNMYLETRDLGDMMDIYYAAWEKGVKTTYYLHMKPRHQAEQSTVKVNKAEEISGGRKGFASVGAGAPAPAAAPATTETAPAAAPARRGFGFGGLTSNSAAGGENK